MENGIEKKIFTNDRSVVITTLGHVFSEKIIITAVNNGARTVILLSSKKSKENAEKKTLYVRKFVIEDLHVIRKYV